MSIFSRKYIAEKWNDAGFQKYFSNTGWLFFTRIMSMAMGFVIVAIVARYLGPTNYGILSYAFSFVGIFSFIASLGIDNVLYRDLVKYPERENELVGTALILKMISGAIAVTILMVAVFISPEESVTRGLIIIISISYIFQAFGVINYCFQARVKAKYPSIANVAVVLILSALKLAVVFSSKGIYYFAAIYALEPVLYGIFFIYFYKKMYGDPFRWSFRKSTAKDMLQESLPLMLSTVFITIYARIDQIMIKHMIDVTSVGIYDAAVRLSEVWYFFPGIIVSSLYPSIVNAHSTDKKSYAKRLIYLTLMLVAMSLLIGLAVTIFAKWIVLIVFGSNFVEGYHVLQLYVWSGVGISIGAVLNQYLVTEKLTSLLLYISIIGMLLNIALNLFLIPRYGISGSAFATLVSYIVGPLSIMCFPKPRRLILGLVQTLQNKA